MGTGNAMNVLAGATFTANGWNGLDGTGNTLNTITVDGAGSKASFSTDNNDGFGNSSGSDRYTSNRVNITNGGVVYVSGTGICNFVSDTAGTYGINVDGAGGRSVLGTSGISWMGGSGGGIAHVFNGGALETHGSNPNQFNGRGDSGQFQKVFIDGGVLSYRNASAVQMTESTAGEASYFTYAGNNALRLNNSAATDTGSYTFADNLGAKNYTRLELVNGTTSVARDITIDGDNGGSMLVDLTTATIHGDLLLTGAAVLEFAIEDPTKTDYSQIIGDGGELALSGTLMLDFSGGTYGVGWTSEPLFAGDYTSSHSGTFATVSTTGLDPGLGATFNSSDLTVTVMPEPATMALLGLGGLGLLLRRKRK